MYKIIRAFLFRFNTETVHYFAMNLLENSCKLGFAKKLLSLIYTYKHKSLHRVYWNIKFTNPVGLGAGFDKNARYLTSLETLGFGFVEIGTVTPKPQDGNPKPRLFRLPKDGALINRMGFNNEGAEAIAQRLANWRIRNPNSHLIIGGNIGKNKDTPNETAWSDYQICFEALFPYVDYFVVNVSSPNTPGLRALQDKDALKEIFSRLNTLNQAKTKRKPILLKIAPDLSNEQLDDIVSLCQQINIDGLVATNTTISRQNLKTSNAEIERIGMGGLSGQPIKQRSNEVLDYLAQRLTTQTPIIASGGIFTKEDAIKKVLLGASLMQVWTGFVYEGPGIAKKICKGLVDDEKTDFL